MTKFNFKNSLLATLAVLSGLTAFSQGVCTQFSYFYADITYPNGGEQTDLYSIQLDGADAIMTPIGTLDVGVHIAYNTESGLLYAIDDNTGEISIVDPITGDIISTTDTDLNVGKVTTAAFNGENILLLGSENGNIYQVDNLLSDPIEVSVYSDGNDISGGDITFSEAGNLYLAAKPQGKLYEVFPGFANPVLGNVNGNVTGMATLEDGEGVIVSSRTNNQFLTYSLNGGVSETAAYNAILDGEPFTLGNGDMSSGCSERSTSLEGCDDYRTYYIHNAQGSGTDILYAVDFNDMGGAMLNEVAVVANNSHLGIGSNGFLYIVEGSSGTLQTFNPLTLGVENEVQINQDGNNLSGFPAVVVGDDGFVYVGKGSNNTIYKVDPSTGDAEIFGQGNVSGGDLIFVGESLWLANRAQGRFYEINGAGQFDVDAEDINGVAVLPDGKLLIANGNLNGLFEVFEPITGNATGETFETGLVLFNGDLAGRCFDGQPEFQGCENFQTFYIHRPQGSNEVTLFSVALSDLGDANLTELRTLDGGSHLGIGPNGLLYIVNGSTGVMTVLDLDTDTEVQLQINEGGSNITGIPAVVVGDDGFVYVGADNDVIYKVDPSTGAAIVFGEADVNGGDLVFVGGALWLANRANSTFYEVNGTGQFSVAASEINGVSVLPDGNLLIANGDLGSTFDVYEPITGLATGTEYETGLEIFNGDLASRCIDGDDSGQECENYQLFISASGSEGGDVYRVTLGEGSASLELLLENLGDTHLAYDESNGLLYVVAGSGSVAIYDPVADILTSYANIAMGDMNVNSTYAAVVTNDGTLLVGSDNQNTVYEVDPATGAASNPVDAPVNGGDLVQTLDGNVWVINRDQNRFYNITDGVTEFDVELDEMYGAALLQSGMILIGDQGNQLRVVDPATLAATAASFELPISISAGDLAGGCGDNYEGLEQPADDNVVAGMAILSDMVAYPNPTEGISNVEFVAATSERAVMEVFDMSGRSVATLLNQEVQKGNTYRLTFDGTSLPNGIYVVKYVTQSETAIEKIMIAR